MSYGEYLVTGRRQYRGHDPGTTFEAILDAGAEARAIARGDITLLRRVTPSLVPGSYRFAPGWLDRPEHESTEAPTGASLVSKEGS